MALNVESVVGGGMKGEEALGWKPPGPPTQGPLLTDQINLTDEELRIMPVAGGGSSNATTRSTWAMIAPLRNNIQGTSKNTPGQPRANRIR